MKIKMFYIYKHNINYGKNVYETKREYEDKINEWLAEVKPRIIEWKQTEGDDHIHLTFLYEDEHSGSNDRQRYLSYVGDT